MPLSQRKLDKLIARASGRQFDALEDRYQKVLGAYYEAQRNFCSTQQECGRLRLVVRAKQQVIDLLLPYYPHPLTAELRHQISLA